MIFLDFLSHRQYAHNTVNTIRHAHDQYLNTENVLIIHEEGVWMFECPLLFMFQI